MSVTKAKALGMSWGAANGRLRKMILFDFVRRLGLDRCHRCNEKIESIDDLSIEHKDNWMQADDPVKSFFDLGNLAFSHLNCNIKAGAQARKKWGSAQERSNASHRRWWAKKTPEARREYRKMTYKKYGH